MLKSLQKKNINNKKIIWLKNLDELNKNPSIFVANEFCKIPFDKRSKRTSQFTL